MRLPRRQIDDAVAHARHRAPARDRLAAAAPIAAGALEDRAARPDRGRPLEELPLGGARVAAARRERQPASRVEPEHLPRQRPPAAPARAARPRPPARPSARPPALGELLRQLPLERGERLARPGPHVGEPAVEQPLQLVAPQLGALGRHAHGQIAGDRQRHEHEEPERAHFRLEPIQRVPLHAGLPPAARGPPSSYLEPTPDRPITSSAGSPSSPGPRASSCGRGPSRRP